MNWRDVPIPEKMSKLPLDKRGYPVPWIIQTDENGIHFIINDAGKIVDCARMNLCGICGRPLVAMRMFVGGVRNAFHKRGAYADPPMHEECAHYALQVCPFLAMPSYRGADMEAHKARVTPEVRDTLVDITMLKGKPILFVALLTDKFDRPTFTNNGMIFKPRRPYKRIEYWRDGKEVPWTEAHIITKKIMSGELAPTIIPN